jgi:FKBP-type peptidyl-prolyl cis-trans isomerase 2
MIKNNDFIEIEYTGKTKEEELVFDTTDEKLAKEAGIAQEGQKYGPMVVCVGQKQVVEGLDKQLTDKEVGKEYTIELKPEDAFGKKSAKLIQLVPTRKFKESDVMPQPGLQIDVDGMMGIIKSVSGGRTLVDFNHPLSGKDIIYEVKILRKVDDDKEKLDGLLKAMFGMEMKAELKEGKAIVEVQIDIQDEMKKEITKKIKETIPAIKDIEFKKEEEKKDSPDKGENKEVKE